MTNDDTAGLERLREALSLMASDPEAAADLLEGMAARLLEHARSLRSVAAARAAQENPFASGGGMGDSARIQVVGPDGKIKADINTRGRP
jgi:hypothetical protein